MSVNMHRLSADNKFKVRQRNIDAPDTKSQHFDGLANVTVTSDLSSLETEWRDFEQHAECTPFQKFDWLDTWQSCIGSFNKVTPAVVSGRNEDGSIAFILPLAVERLSSVRRLVFLGGKLGDYNAPLLAKNFVLGTTPQAWWKAIRAKVQQAPDCACDLVFLDKMPETVGTQSNPLCKLKTTLNASHAYATALEGDWETYYAAKRSTHARRNDRRKFRHLQNSGDVNFHTATGPPEINETLDILFSQKERSFARMGVPNLFDRPGVADFFRKIATKAPELIHVSRLEVGTQWAAANLALVSNGSYYSVLISHDDGSLRRYSPGLFHQHELMRYAMANGCNVFDFTIGDEPFKRDWAETIHDLHDHLAPATPLGVAIAVSTSVKLQAKRTIKQTPHLWTFALKTRTRLGSLLGFVKTKPPQVTDDNAEKTAPKE